MSLSQTTHQKQDIELVVARPEGDVDIAFDGRAWRWVHHYHAGKSPGVSSEGFTTALKAAQTAAKIAKAHSIETTDFVRSVIMGLEQPDAVVPEFAPPEPDYDDERETYMVEVVPRQYAYSRRTI